MRFNDFLKQTLVSGKTPIEQLKYDLATFKSVFNYATKTDDLYNNLIENIVKLLKIKFGNYQILYTNNEIMYNELLITLNPQIPQFLMIQKKQLIENLNTFGDLNNWGDILKDNVSRKLNLNESGSDNTNYIPIDSNTKEAYSSNDLTKINETSESTDVNRLATDYLNFYAKLSWNIADIELDNIYSSYIHLFRIYYEFDNTAGGVEDDSLVNQVNQNTGKINQIVEEIDTINGELETLNREIATTNNRFNNYYTSSESDNRYATKTQLNNYYTKSESDGRYINSSQLNNYYTKSESDSRYATKTGVLEKSFLNIMFPVGSIVMTADNSTHQLVLMYPRSFQEITDDDIAYLAIGRYSSSSNILNYTIQRNQLPNVDLSHNHSVSIDTKSSTQPWNFGNGGNVWNGATRLTHYTTTTNLYLNGNTAQQPLSLNIKPKTLKIRVWKVISNLV